MKKFCYTLLLLFGMVFHSEAQILNPKFDQKLADSLGADQYGMKYYSFVILKTGNATITNKDSVDLLFKGHMINIQRLVKENKLIVAGPFGKNDKSYRGLFILNVKTIKEAEELLATDPAVKAKMLSAEITLWYGSAALPMYLESTEKVTKTSF